MPTAADRETFRGRRVLVVGLGVHGGGEATVRWLVRHGAKVRVTDRKTKTELIETVNRLKTLSVTWRLGGHRRADFAWAELIVQNPGVPDSLPELAWGRRRGRPILGEANIFFERCSSPILAVTGTRGKTTTTLLLAHILKTARRRVAVSGNVRQVAMLDYLDRLTPKDIAVLELSSFQLERLTGPGRSADVAIMTNLHVDHLNRYATLSAYADAKYSLFRRQTSNDIAVLNAENFWTIRAAAMTAGQVWWFQRRGRRGRQGVTVEKGWLVSYERSRTRRILPERGLPLPGRHQLENTLAAVTAALAWSIRPADIRRAVASFTGLPHRQELVRTWRGRRFINDTTATTPDGTLAALDVFPHAIYILGGADKRLRYGRLAKVLVARRTSISFLPGSATVKLRRALRRAGYRGPMAVSDDLAAALHQAVDLAKPGQAIVLSPAAASFGLFAHEFDRGEQFVRLVKQLR